MTTKPEDNFIDDTAAKRPRRLLRYKDLPEPIRFARPYLNQLAKQGQFPQPLKISTRTIAWVESEIQEFIDSRERRGGAQ